MRKPKPPEGQPGLWDAKIPKKAMARKKDPKTSKRAAERVKVETREEQVLGVLRTKGDVGMTSSDIAQVLQIGRDSVSPRMKPLCENGKVEILGMRDGETVWLYSGE